MHVSVVAIAPLGLRPHVAGFLHDLTGSVNLEMYHTPSKPFYGQYACNGEKCAAHGIYLFLTALRVSSLLAVDRCTQYTETRNLHGVKCCRRLRH